MNTPGTAGGPGGRDRTLAVKSRKTHENHYIKKNKKIKLPNFFFLDIPSSYAKILRKTNFQPREFSKSE